jgi:ketol-acid reductoisomerase
MLIKKLRPLGGDSLLKYETVAVLAYSVHSPGQVLSVRDKGIGVIVGQRERGQS